MVEFQNIVKTTSGYKVFVEHFRAARKINKKVMQYKKDDGKLYTFQEGEEAIFTVPQELYKFCLKTMKSHNCLY
jgi:hypothetical protein